jgi:hypothetical protein
VGIEIFYFPLAAWQWTCRPISSSLLFDFNPSIPRVFHTCRDRARRCDGVYNGTSVLIPGLESGAPVYTGIKANEPDVIARAF